MTLNSNCVLIILYRVFVLQYSSTFHYINVSLLSIHRNTVFWLVSVHMHLHEYDNPCFNEGLKALYVCTNVTLMSDYDQKN